MPKTHPVMNLSFETRYLAGERVQEASIKSRNCFDLAVMKQLLEREGYSVIPARYKTDASGYLTDECWLWRASNGSKTIKIFA